MNYFARNQALVSLLTIALLLLVLIPFGFPWYAAFALLGAAAIVMFLIVIGASLSPPRQETPPQQRKQSYLYLFALPWAFVGFVVLTGAISSIDRCRILTCRTAPWDTQRLVAMRAAQRHDKQFAPFGVHASPRYHNGRYDYTVLATRFHFVTPAGDELTVRFEDSHPWLTSEVSDQGKTTARPSPVFGTTLANVQISPAAALQATLAEARTFLAQGEDIYAPDIWLVGPDEIPSSAGIVAAWHVAYHSKRGERVATLYLLVDAQTGRVVDRDERP